MSISSSFQNKKELPLAVVFEKTDTLKSIEVPNEIIKVASYEEPLHIARSFQINRKTPCNSIFIKSIPTNDSVLICNSEFSCNSSKKLSTEDFNLINDSIKNSCSTSSMHTS